MSPKCRESLPLRLLTALLLATCFGLPMVAAPDATVWPGKEWDRAAPAKLGLDAEKLAWAREYALSGDGSGMIVRHGKLALAWGDLERRYDLKSTSKSIGVTALGLAIGDGKLSLDTRARKVHPTLGTPPRKNEKTGWLDEITIFHLATQTAGFEKPGGFEPLVFRPGTKWHYSDGGPNWLAECVTLVYGRDVQELLFERVFKKIGIAKQDLRWRRNAYRDRKIRGVERREFGSGVHANVDAMARIGYLYLHKGRWKDEAILPESFVEKVSRPQKEVIGLDEHGDRHGNASDHYGLLWWNNADGTLKNVPRDAYWSWGLYDSLIVIVPSLDLVVSRAGKSWKRESEVHYDVLRPFLEPIVEAVRAEAEAEDGTEADADTEADTEAEAGTETEPDSDRKENTGRPSGENASGKEAGPRIAEILWAPPETIVRRARGSDNWPLTWADDGALYTAYGDGWGFEPRMEEKLSLGFARVSGPPGDFRGENIRSASGERRGDGARGAKASGILMVDGVLYLWARNTDNSQLVTSTDHARTWSWSDWRFTESFGAPTFLNFGKDYQGARDAFVYVYSFDSDSAYEPADRMVLARVPKDRIEERQAYRFFAGFKGGEPAWEEDIAARRAVLEDPGDCYRSGVTYSAPLRRYLWAQVKGGRDTRFEGGLAVYEAAEPWGPWHEIFRADRWDVGPGESASFPSKWLSKDGRTAHLVFSGEDAFSVRRATLRLRP